MISMRVLVIEDDADTRANLRDILELDGYEVAAAGSVAEVMGQDMRGVSIILLDRRLPDGTAEELLPHLREIAPEAACIVVTAYADLDSALGALRHGASDYLLKPINPDALRAAVARISEQRRAEARLLQADRLSALGEAMTCLAHESRNALQRSQANLEMLAREVKDQPKALEYIARLQRAQDDLHTLYEEVREYAVPIRLALATRDIGALVAEAWDHLAVRRAGRQVAFRQLPTAIDRCCEVDGFAMRQVFRNILENALAACKDPVEIEVAFSEAVLARRRALVVRLRDNGPGLSAECRKRIFEAFFTTKTHGTGLGMAIAKRFVEAHGGEIDVGNAHHQGAEIVITLPRIPS